MSSGNSLKANQIKNEYLLFIFYTRLLLHLPNSAPENSIYFLKLQTFIFFIFTNATFDHLFN
jgi:hypothetical protein